MKKSKRNITRTVLLSRVTEILPGLSKSEFNPERRIGLDVHNRMHVEAGIIDNFVVFISQDQARELVDALHGLVFPENDC